MIYANYKNRIAKLKVVLQTIYKFRILIVSVLSAVLLITAGMLLSSGAILSVSLEVPTITYGEDVVIDANAVLADVFYEYSDDGGKTWKEGLPTLPSNQPYLVRAYAFNAFGGKRTSDAQQVVIDFRKITIEVNEGVIMYGETPMIQGLRPEGVTIGGLVDGDSVTCSNFQFDFINLGENGNNVYSSDDLIESGATVFSVSGANTAVVMQNFATDNPTITMLVKPDVNALTIYNAKGENVTRFYNITVPSKLITVTPREVSIKLADAEFVYNGTSHISENYEIISGSFADGDVPELRFSGARTNADEVAYSTKAELISVKTADGKDVTKFYNIDITDGSVQINKATINILSESQENYYKGAEISYEKPCLVDDKTPLVDGDSITFKYPSMTEIGELDIDGDSVEIHVYDASGKETTANYSFEFVSYSMFSINPRPIKITTHDLEWEYDGIAHQEGSTAYGSNDLTIDNVEYFDLLEGHTIVVSSSNSVKNVVDSGTPNTCEFTIKNGEKDVTDHYDIDYICGILKINPREITVQSGSATNEYDGTALTCDSYSIIPREDGKPSLVGGDKLNVYCFGAQVNCGDSDNEFSTSISNASNPYADENYKINPINGKLTVTPRKITVKSGFAKKEYDGTPLTCHECEAKRSDGKPALIGSDYIDAKYMGSQTDVGKSENDFTAVVVNDSNPNANNNYEITLKNDTLTVTKRQITVQSRSDDKEYDGTPLTCHEFEIVERKDGEPWVITGDGEIVVTVTGSRVNAGSADNTFNAYVEKDGAENTNYEIVKDEGTLTVNPRQITVQSGSKTKEYDGTPLTCHEFEIVERKDGEPWVITGDGEIVVTVTGSRVNAGSADNTFNAYVEKDGAENTNYEIVPKTGTLTVTPRKITVKSGSKTKEYDGTPLTCESYTIVQREDGKPSLIGSDYIDAKYTGSQTEVGESKNTFTAEVKNDTNPNANNNYEITLPEGTLKVTLRRLVLSPKAEKTYDATNYIDVEYLDGTSLANGQTLYSYSVDNLGINAGTYNGCKVSSVVIKDKNGNDVTSNYDITCPIITVTVKQKPIKISPKTEKIYDGTKNIEIEYLEDTSLVKGQTLYSYSVDNLGINVGTYNG